MALFLTGATGFLGTEVAAVLAARTDETIYALVRARDEEEATHRLRMFWHDVPDLYREIGRRVRPLAGDFTQPDLGLAPETVEALKGTISKVYHTGAETGIQKSRKELMTVNRKGTGEVLRFARKINRKGSLERFVFISSAYVAGLRSGTILETDPLPERYATYYEESKALAEKLVLASGLPYTICRPGMIVGNTESGRIRSFNTVYYVLKLMLQGKLPTVPVSAGQRINIVPVDYVADAVVRLGDLPEAENACFHLTSPEEMKPTAGELADFVQNWAREELKLSVVKPIFAPVPGIKQIGLSHNRKKGEKKKGYMSNIASILPYFFDEHIFDRAATDRLLDSDFPDWRTYMDNLLRFAVRRNFLQQTDRNVFEQVLFRMKSKSAPISYYDVAADGIRETTGQEMIDRILAVRDGLIRLGVRKGDKVALTGSNCTDYFSLDIAVGLAGAVSVPIYYTTPVEEIDLLLGKSGAKWFFVGDRRIMKQIDGLKSTVPVIAFFTALEVPAGERAFMTWEDFLETPGKCGNSAEDKAAAAPEADLARSKAEEMRTDAGKKVAGESADAPRVYMDSEEPHEVIATPLQTDVPRVYVDPEDLATIRYTSGTTGEPKGVMFNAGQLAWMGQVLTDLLSWKDRQREMRYLSFLPLSHVVEGILASYAPYYVHCPVKFYYLNDFDKLTEALPKVRPNVFFSVPRFYEKLWQQIEENPVGKRYLAMSEGAQKNALGFILRKAVLKKAGLDQCAQLIVGSAPISEELLLKLRRLGIEVHNAYGQTEAPLITINRLGDNVIPSIGTPLPETKVTVEPDGELIVEGPQVCLGYYGLETDTIRDGVLRTGDLGRIDEAGHIYLIGRKKEMIITSYGKNINCPKIEERLKNISGVSEAVLIGENRPYCTALLWLEENADESILPTAIEEMNTNLSHPEQIRRWTVVREPLSIRKGELTPNLKVKRNVVQDHYGEAIDEMYKG